MESLEYLNQSKYAEYRIVTKLSGGKGTLVTNVWKDRVVCLNKGLQSQGVKNPDDVD